MTKKKKKKNVRAFYEMHDAPDSSIGRGGGRAGQTGKLKCGCIRLFG